MKKFSILLSLISVLLILQCTNENPENNEYLEIQDPNFRVTESSVKHNFAARASYDDPCLSTDLIAGQNHIAGTVSVDSDGDNLIITYSTNEGWTIDLTHLSIGDCVQSIPTTGSGNPKVGRFEHTEPHSVGTNEVIYHVSLDAVPEPFYNENGEYIDNYCFAAHAEVTGPDSEETAWADGTDFEGNNWAMFVEAKLSDCDLDYCENDLDCDGIPNESDTDKDGDGFLDKVLDEETGTYLPLISYSPDSEYYDENVDNCPETYNPEQHDLDLEYNEYGEVTGYAPDGVGDECDNCKDIPNEDQHDLNDDGIGDACAPVK